MLNAFLAASLFLTLGCSQGSQTVDEFLGPDGENGDSTPDSAIDFDPTTWDFGSQLITVGTPLSKTVTVTNKSAGVVYIGALTGSGAPYFTVAAETCTTATAGLAQNQTCTFVVEFLPTAAGLHNFTITVGFGSTSGSSAKSASMGMIGTGIAPANLILSDGPSFNFGPVVVSATSEKTFNVSNAGGYPATTVAGGGLSAPFTFKGGSYPGTGGTCGTTLGAGATCSVVVMFSPTATGVQNDAIELDYFNGDANVQSTRAITGTGSTPAALAISDGPTFNYGDIAVGGVSEKVFTINNTGGVSAATVSGSGLALPFAFKGGNFPGTGGTCSGLIASGASCTIVVTYSPTSAAPSSDAIDIQYFDGLATQTESRAVQGTGVPPAALSISNGPTYNFGTVVVGSVNDVTLTISNSGGVAATALTGSGLNAPFSFKGGTYPGAGGTCGVSLAAAGSCTVVVTYAPTAVASNTGTVTIGFNNGVNAQTATRAVQGQAVSLANLTISDGPTFNYGTRPVGSNNDRTFTINNTGGWPATAVVGGGLAAPYTFKGGSYPGTGGTCAGTINAGTNCTIVVTYAPTASGTTGDSIELTYDNGIAALVSSRAVAGTAVGPAVLSISDGPTFDFGTQPIGKLLEKSFTVQNTGGFNATAVSGAGLAAPYTFKGGSYPGTGGTCAATLAPGASCTVIVTYTVPAAVTSADTLEIQYNDGNVVQTATRDITGTGVTPANLSISDAPAYDFGPIATGGVAEATLTISNTGTFVASAMAGSGLTAPYTFKGGTYPGTGGTCGTTLAGGATCTVVIRFAPTTVGSVSRTLSMAYNDGVVAQTSTRTIQGLGAPPALLVISDGPTFNYGSIPFGSTATKTFTITNSGGVTANTLAGSGLSAPFTFLGGSYPGTGGSCGATLAATATCTIVVEYAPTAAGTTTRTISITYNNTVSNQTATRAIAGSAVNPANITISGGTTYNFGTIAVGGVLEATLTLNNSGQFVASGMVSGGTIAAPFTFKGGSYPGTGGTCTATLNAGASCTIVLAFNPTIAGAQPGTVDVSFNNGVSIQTTSRALTGTGAAPALLTISNSPSYDFGSVATGGFAEFTFTITNGGGFPASAIAGGGLAAPFAFKGGTYPGTGGTCGITLNAAATCTIVVRFSPTVVTTSTDAIELNYFDGAVAQLVTRTVDGTGVSPALLSWSDGPTFDFGPVPTTGTAEKIFTITNTGTATATAMSGVALPLPFRWKGGTYPGTAGTCASSLAPAATCTVVVTFNPTALGTFTTNASISYNNGANTVTGVRAIQGVGANPGALVISDGPTFNFGSWPNGDTREKTFTVSNTGGVPSTGISGGGLAAPYSYKGGTYPGTGGTCTTSLAATATCTIVVQYSPVALGTTSSTINLAYNTGIAAANSTRGVQGTAVAPANLVISDGATYNYGTVAVGASADKFFTVTNSGAFPASVMSGGGVAVPFTFKGGSYPGTGGTCAATLNAGASCTLVVTYSPSTTGLQSGTVEVNYSNGVTPQISARAVQGTGAVPALLTVNEGPTFDYGTLPSGGTADKTFIITNSGGVPATAISGSGLAAPFAFKGGNFPGTGGTCTTSLAASATCTFVVTYAPTAPGLHADVVDINYTDGVGPQQTNRAIQGTAVPQATLAISDGPTYDYGTRANGSSTDYTFTVTNSGGVSATAVAGTSPTTGMFRFKGGTYPGTDGTCTTSLASGANCVIVVTYSPTASGNHTGTITLSFNTGVVTTTSSRALTGRGQPPANITISDGPTFSYGLRASGSSTDKTFTITNTGGVPATSLNGAGLAAPFEFKDGPYPGTGGTCGATLNAAATCTIIVTYEPAATGAYSDSIELTYDNGVLGGQLSQRAVTGTAAAPASLSISDGPTYDYGTLAVGGVAHKSFTINNSGGVQATSVAGGGLAAPYSFRGGTYPGTGGTCGTTLNAGASCVVWVSYSPAANDGPHLDSLEINFNNGLGATVASRDLTGNADAPAVISISDGPTFNFGTHPTTSSVDKVFTLTNTGEFTATAMTGSGLTAPIRFKGGTYPGTGGTCGASLNGAASCTVVVTFNPTANGSYNQTMTIGFNNGLSAQNSTRQILATGAPPATLAISDGPTFNFGTIANGGVAEKILTVTNSGGVAATAIAGTGLSAPYSYKGGGFPGTGGTCGATLNAATACTMVVEFSPTALGMFSSSATINFSNGLTGQSVSRAITGTAANPANLTLSDGPAYDYGTRATGATVDRTFTLTNSGNVSASSLAGAGLAAPFTFKGGTFPGTGGTCGTSLAASASCTVVVNWSPTATGPQSDTVEVNYWNGATNQTTTRLVQGVGATPALLSISDSPSFDYGTLASGSSVDKSFTITNSGGVSATGISGGGLATPFVFKGGTFPGTGGTCGATLADSATCTIVVTYNPTTVGARTDDIELTYNNGANSQSATRTVNGTSVPPANITISDGATFNFGTVANTASADKTFTLTNAGSFTATSLVGTGLSGMFSYKGGSYPGTGGTCGGTLNVAATCTVVVTFAPTASGLHSSTVNIGYFNGATTVASTRPVQGTGAPPANLTISDGPSFDFGTRATGSSTDKSFTISNTGGVPATSVAGAGLAAPFTFKGGTYPGTGGTCANTIAASATCTIVVTYAPTATGAQSDSIDFTYDSGVTGQSVARIVQGIGAAPASLSISDSPLYDYGSIANGAVLDRSFTITNSGGVPATALSGGGLAAPFSFKGGTFPGTGGTCTSTLAASGTCTVVVSFAPTAAGLHTDTLDLTYNDGVTGQSVSRDVQGTGVMPALLMISDGPTFDYGPVVVTGTQDKTFTITNTGSLQATTITGGGLVAPFTFKGGSYPGTGGTCGATLAAAASCTVVVTFAPTVTGGRNDTIEINYFDGALSQQSTRPIQGSGAPPASITISDGPTFSFGILAQGADVNKTFTLTNSGGVPATAIAGSGLAAPFSFKDGTYPGTGGTCGATLAAAATCTIVVNYNPTTIATHNDTIEIAYNDGLAAQNAARNVTGTGVAPGFLSISDGATYDYGIVATGGSAEKIFTVTNTGSFAASAVSGTGLATPFTFKGGTYPGTGGNCGATLNAGASCTVVVVYAPSATGTQSDAIEMNYFDGAGSQTANRAIQGTGAAPALLTISDGITFDFGSVANGSTNEKSFTISNSGGVPATGISGGGLAAPFNFKGGTFPGTGGTCGATLASAANCTIVVQYLPTTNTTHNDTIEISYTNGVTSGNLSTRPATGTALPPANITISDGPTFNFGSVANGISIDKTFTLTNSGSFTATTMTGGGLAAPYTYKGGTYPGAGGTCSTTLAGAATCTVVVNFSPTTSATHNDTIEIAYSNGATNQTSLRNVTGISAPPASLTISDGPTFAFGTRATGSSTDKSFTVTNSGGVAATSVSGGGLAAPFTFKGGTFPGTGGTCAASITAGDSCTVVVTYAPTATGAQSDTMDISFNDGVTGQTSSRAMNGTGAAPASLAISNSPTYDFGLVASGGFAEATLTVANSGGVPATALSGGGLAAPFTFKGGTFPGTGGTCTTSLAASLTCTVVVNYSPTNVAVHNDTMDITFNNGVAAGQTSSRDITGTAVAPALLTISDSPSFDYGPVVATGSSDKTFTINNTGSVAATTVTGTGLAAPFTFKGGSYPGSGGTCGGTINASASCTIVITFNPSVTGPASDSIEMNYNDGAVAQTATRAVQGTGATPANITISDGATFSFGTVAQGSSNSKTFTVSNTGGVPATVIAGTGLSAPFSFKGGTFPGTGGTCTATLAAAANCTVVVDYNPSTIMTHNATMDITFNNGLVGGNTSSRAMTGTAVAPALIDISDGATFNFGTVATGGSAEKVFTLTNNGSFAASAMTNGGSLAAPFSYKGGSYPGTGGNCAAVLNPAATCTVVVVYAPTATGVQNGTLDISYNNGASGQTSTRAVTGTGASPASITISNGPTYNFGSVATGGSADHTFTLNNTGGVPATSIAGGGLAAPYTFKGGSFPGTGGTCTGPIAAGGSCTVVVTFAPTVGGAQNDTMDITFNNGVSAGNTVSRDITGTGVAPASLAISDGATFNYGPVVSGGALDKTFTITNSGILPATSVSEVGLAAPFAFKGGSFPGSGGTCTTSIAGGASCTIVVTFSPTATGSFSDTIDFTYGTGAGSTNVTRDVEGVGATPATVTISDGATFNFGTLAQGGTADKTFTLNNTGGVSATVLAGTGLAAPFSFKGGTFPGTGGTCTATLAAADSCTVVVTYSPVTAAIHNDTMDINYNDGVTGQTSQRAMTGTAVPPAVLAISDSPGYDFGTVVTGTTNERTFTVTNSGSFSASAMGGSGLAAPFAFKGGSYPGTGGTCTTALAASASCTVVVVYIPTGTGLQSATMAIAYNDGANVQSATRNIQGTGAAPALLSLSDGPTFSFGTRANGSSTDKTFVLSNTGGVTATSIAGSGLLAPYSFKGGTFPGTGGSCTTTLAAAANCTIVVTFAPSATATHSATMQVSYNDGSAGANTTRDITGVSAAPAALTISDGAIFNFGTIVTGTSSDKSFTINNTGGVVASGMSGSGLAAPFTFKGGTYPGAGGNCGATLSAGASCTVIVTFNPTVSTTSNDTMDIIFNDGVTGQISSRDLQGTGGPPANITISDGATFNYGTVANTSNNDKTFTLSNTGGAAATSMAGTGLAAPFGFKGGTYPGTGGTCGATLNGSDTCTIVVTYSPTSVGAQNDTIEINYYDGAASQQATRALAGTAVAPALLEISDGLTYDYGTQPLTKATDKTFTVTNNGSFSSSSMSGGGLAAPFAFKGGSYPGTGGTCGAALSPAASCTIVVTYTPTASGVHSGTINVNYNNGATAQSATRGVQGLGATAAILAISDGPTFSYGIRAISLSGEKTFTVSNSGGVSATGVAGGGLASPFFYKGGTYPGTGGTCTATLGGGSSCTIVVLFTPAAPGPASDTIEVDYNDGLIAQQATRDISGTGANPAYLSISDAVTFSFGTRETSSSTDKSFTLSNTGGVTATSMVASGISSPFTFKGGTFPGTGGTCGSTLMASGTCTFIVTYAPLATGTLNQTITIDYNDAVVSQSTTRPITGTAVAPAAPTALSRLLPAASPNNLDTVRVRVGGVVEGNTVRVFSDSACTAELASGVVGVGQTTIDIDFNVTVDGAYTFYANRSNTAASACSTATASYTRDTVAPTISGIANQTPGRSPHWSQSPTFRVSGSYAIGDTVELFSNGTCTSAVQATGTTANTNQIDLTTSISLQGTYQYWARGRDPAGNQSSCFGPIVYNQDTSDITVEFSSWSQVVNENSTVTVGLNLSASKPYPVSLYFKAQGTAIEGTHTSGLAAGTITIPANTTSYNFTFDAINNGLVEKDKYVDLVLWDSSYEYVHPAGAIYHRVLIKDNDSSVVAPLALPFGNGNAFSCFVDGRSKLWCVGANSFGNLGVGDLVDREGYVAVDTSTDYTQVSVGQWHACGLTSTGVVKCWGADNSGQMGNGVGTLANLEPQDVGLGTGNKFVAAGANSVCVIRSDDRLSCWGENSSGQLGDLSTTQRNSPVAVDGSNTYSKVVMGVNQACGLRTNQKMFCWGQNANGATGLGVTSGNTTTPTAVDATVNFIDVAAGDDHFCAITTANKMKCWGWGGFGQLGSGSTADRTTPLAVDTAQNYTSVAAGRAHTCGVVQTSGAMRCTGNNNMAQHFDRQQLQTTIFYGVAAGLSFAGVSAFEDSSWGLLTNGEVYYAGGDLPFAFSGDNRSTLVKVAPTQIDDGRTFSSLDRGWGERSFCAISNSKIRCSGFSNGSDAIFGIGPTALLVGSSWTDAKNDYTMVGSGWQHICGLQQVAANQKLFCSGNASFNGSGVASNLMVAVDSANNYVSLSVGYNHSCAIRSSGALVCWGSNSNSKLGDGTTVTRLTPVVVDSGTAYVKISAGFEHTCGITSLGVLKCWGTNANGRTGLNTTSGSRSTPGVVDSGVSYAEVSAGENHTCGVTTTGVLKCWGNNNFGMLGLGSTTQFLVPQTVGSSFSRVAAAQNSTCAITSSGGLRCAGQWNLGMAGQTNTNWLSLATVDGGTTYTEIRAGRLSMCALDSAGRVRCWGNNFYNTFGNTTNIWFPEAVPVPGFNQ